MVLSDVPNGRAISKCFYVESDDTYTVNQRICKLTSKKSISKFLFSLLDRNPYFLSFDDGVKQTNLKNDDVLNCPLVIPKDSKEQQKIADCLSSLDKLVNAHNQKLDALKAHKKGLMQQLFPAEGETVPKLRFPEFEGDGDWCFYDLGSKAKKVGSGITPKGGDKNYKSAGVPFVRSQNIGWGSLLLDNIAYIEEEVHQSFLGTEIKENDVLLNITGASIGRSAIADQRVTSGNVNQHVCIIRTKIKELHPVYLCQFILSPNGQLQIDSFQAGGNREGLNFAQIRSFSIPIPPNVEEQKKIADGLSSIDELITAQSKKIDALKAHKKGLMQQLFPKVNEVSA
jgi:type I restriction enzyme, S subunit